MSKDSYLKRVLSKRDRLILAVFIGAWIIGQVIFWYWWLQPEHMVSLWRTVLNSVLLVWSFLMPGYFFFFVWRMKKPRPVSASTLTQQNWRVAMVTTKTPGEPLAVVQKTLLAMLAQDFPHDVWLGDEDPHAETIAWCESHGVRLYSRKDVAAYHQKTWPRRTRCKEGNLAYFYDHFGYDDYDIVVQLDSDHVPTPSYLEAMLTPFLDKEVGYVSAPSICDANAKQSWSARGRLYAEATMHGPLQAGYTNGFAPLCIGSHYAVRTKALKEAGGIGPELAEDHSTSMLMQAAGWRGVHALDAIAHGDGPLTFADCMKQEFQWSRSLAVLLVAWLPRYWKKLNWKLRFQFLFAQLWYPLFTLSMFFGFLLSVAALLMRTPWVSVSYLAFVAFSTSFSLIAISVVALLKKRQLLRPTNAPILSWEFMMYQIVRWPWELIGVITGTMDGLLGKTFEIKVTPKGGGQSAPLPARVLLPYFAIIVFYFGAAFFINHPGSARGYYYFVLLGLLFYIAAIMTIIIGHYREARTAKAMFTSKHH